MISNLRKAAHDRDTVMIGGGEFDRDDLLLAAHMLDCYPDLLEAGQELVDKLSGMAVHPSHYAGLVAALAKANQHPARGMV